MAIPAFIGKSTAQGSNGPVTIDFTGVGHQEKDWTVVCVVTANQHIVVPSGFAEPSVSPQFRGTAELAGGIRLAVFAKESDGTETTVSIADSGNHQYAVGFVVRPDAGKVLAIDASAGKNAAASTSHDGNGITTTANDCLVVDIWGTDRDSAGPSYSGEANADLTSLTEQHDAGTTANTGSGIVIYTGEKATAGSVTATTATSAASVAWCAITLALKSIDPPVDGHYIGTTTGTKVGSGTHTVPLRGFRADGSIWAALAGDFVLASAGVGSVGGTDRDLTITDGSTDYRLLETELFSDGSAYSANFRVAYKFLATPDVNATFGSSAGAGDGSAVALRVYRGIDPVDPIDAATTAATGLETGQPDPPSILPMSAYTGFVVGIGVGASGAAAALTSSDLDDFVAVTETTATNRVQLGVGHVEWTSGDVDPAQFGGGTTDGAESWAAMTVGLRLKAPPRSSRWVQPFVTALAA